MAALEVTHQLHCLVRFDLEDDFEVDPKASLHTGYSTKISVSRTLQSN